MIFKTQEMVFLPLLVFFVIGSGGFFYLALEGFSPSIRQTSKEEQVVFQEAEEQVPREEEEVMRRAEEAIALAQQVIAQAERFLPEYEQKRKEILMPKKQNRGV